MIPKIAACLHAIEMGAKSAQIVDGRVPGILNEAIAKNLGTVITA
jgi:acetylglutamate kinase